jgi:hypothetical protein
VFVVPRRSVVAGSICRRFQRSKSRLIWCPERWDTGDFISFCPSLLQSTSPCPCLSASQRRRRQHLQALSTVQVSSKSRPLSCRDTWFFGSGFIYTQSVCVFVRTCVPLRFLNVGVLLHGCFRVVCCRSCQYSVYFDFWFPAWLFGLCFGLFWSFEEALVHFRRGTFFRCSKLNYSWCSCVNLCLFACCGCH